MATPETATTEAATSPRWQPLEPIERRIMGVLIEKAKTTPENYPLSLNSIRTGSNQKNNRAPLLQLEEEQVEDALESLRKIGAVTEIQGDGRVAKYRHRAYEWLGVEKVELAVMAELLLRGAQTIGELRGRAARMEPIKDLGELRPVLDALQAKRLIAYLTPPGRGCVVSHTLYQDRELDKVRREAASMHQDEPSSADDDPPPAQVIQKPSAPVQQRSPQFQSHAEGLGAEVGRLREELTALKREFQAAREEFVSTAAELRRDLEELNRQLGN
jgi:uncharacterized protein